MWLRIQSVIGFGTERYPEKVARRLRAVNMAAWSAAAAIAFFVIKNPVSIDPFSVVVVAGLAAVPLLHRFGPGAAATGFILVMFAHVARLTFLIGTGDGVWVAFLTAAPLSILFLGVERSITAGILTVLGVAVTIALRVTLPFDTGYVASTILTLNFAINLAVNAGILFFVVYYLSRSAARSEAVAEREFGRSETLLANILPPAVATRLKDGQVIADRYEVASVLFADMAGFTARASDTAPEKLVGFLNTVFTRIDDLVDKHGMEKIKTTGDAYMVVSGVPEPRSDHAEALADLAIALREALTGLVDPGGRAVPVRIGIASGPVVAGVVGRRKFFYDVWGDAVNVAARMEQTGTPSYIQVAPATFELLKDRFDFQERGLIDVRGKGQMRTWYLSGRREALT